TGSRGPRRALERPAATVATPAGGDRPPILRGPVGGTDRRGVAMPPRDGEVARQPGPRDPANGGREVSTVEEEIRELLQRRAERLDRPDLGMPERVVRRARRRATATMAGALLVAAALAAGGYVGVNQLASSSLHGTRPATPPPHHSPAVTPPAPSNSPPSGTPPPVGVSACSRGQLALSDQTQGAAGSVLGSLVITNVSASPCTMSGHPRVA